MEELFRAEKEQLLAITLWNRVLVCIEKLLKCLSDVFGMTPEQILRGLLENEKAISELAGIIEALREANNYSERLAG